jgi:hypothetical protein
MLRFKSYLNEAFNIPITEPKDVDSFNTKYDKKELKKLLNYVKSLKLADVPIVGDGDSKAKKGTIKIRFAGLVQDDITDWIKNNTSLPKTAYDFGEGSLSTGVKKPTGAEWESLITHQINKILGEENHDADAVVISKKFPSYANQAIAVANGFKKIGVRTNMSQYGATGGKTNLSTDWTDWGGTNGTPKTDMYTENYNISLKKKGGSQLASGGSGETIANFNAALAYLGSSRQDDEVINDIMKKIESNFATVYTRFNKGDLAKIAKGNTNVKLSKDDKKVMKLYTKTEKFHKDLNKELMKELALEKRPEFRKWYCFEAMSGLKKFKNKQSVASICATFDPDTGKVSTIPVTSDGKAAGLSETPTVSTEIITLSEQIKIFSAWKSAGKNPRSVLRLVSSYEPTDKVEFPLNEYTLRGIIIDELEKDQYANSVMQNLHEELEHLDEFQLIGKVINKIKGLAKSAKTWTENLFKKIMIRVKKTLLAIKKLGKKMFETLLKFLGLELKSVKETVPKDLHGFFYGMAD